MIRAKYKEDGGEALDQGTHLKHNTQRSACSFTLWAMGKSTEVPLRGPAWEARFPGSPLTDLGCKRHTDNRKRKGVYFVTCSVVQKVCDQTGLEWRQTEPRRQNEGA